MQQNKALHVIKMDLVKKRLERSAETAEKNDDVKEFCEQLGKCFKLGVHGDSTVGAKIAELLRLNVSVDVPVPSVKEEFLEVVKFIPEDSRVPHVMEKSIEVVKHVPQERVHSNTVEAAKFNPEETGQVIQRIEQGRIHDCGGGDKRIYAKHREKVRRVTVDEMKSW